MTAAMLKDEQGLSITTDSTEAIAAINQFIQASLTYGKEAESAILQAITADPNCAIAYAYAAAYYLSQENALDRQQAHSHLHSLRLLQPNVSQREQLYINSILNWARGDIQQAIAYHETIATQFPQDLLSVQQGQYHYFYRGDAVRLLQLAEKVRSVHADNPYWLGMLAFGLEQCHRLAEAEAMGRRATELNRLNPWAHHAVAHVLETQNRIDEGIAWMQSLSDTWDGCNSMLYTHNWWHVALFYLQQGDWETVRSLYHTQVWGRARKQTPKDQVGAISLLLRLDLHGLNLEAEWQDLVPYLLPRIHEHALPFQDLHYVYALARSGQIGRAHEMLVSMVAFTQTLDWAERQRWNNIAIPAARGLIAHAMENWHEAITHLQSVLPWLSQLGGSHTQQALFEQLYRHACQHHASPGTHAVASRAA